MDKSHGFGLILAVENVKLEVPLLSEIKQTNNRRQLQQQRGQQTTANLACTEMAFYEITELL